MTDFHLFCAIQRVWSTSPSPASLLKEAQARWKHIPLGSGTRHFSFNSEMVPEILTLDYICSPERAKAIRLVYRSLKAAGVDVALTI